MELGKIFDFFKCMLCGKELFSTSEQRAIVDKQGVTRIYCAECYEKVEHP